jgi:hypothetical protein
MTSARLISARAAETQLLRRCGQTLRLTLHVGVEDSLLGQLCNVRIHCRWPRHRSGLLTHGRAPGGCPKNAFSF